MGVTRRPATAADADFARAVPHRAYRDVVVRQFGSWDESLQDRFFERDRSSGGFDVVLREGTPCGYLALGDDDVILTVRELVIAPKWQGRGLNVVGGASCS